MVRGLILLAGLVAAIWLGGLVLFEQSIERMQAAPLDTGGTDAIVVLTGGSERVNAGVDLLNAHAGKKLFISGVYPGLTPERLFAGLPLSRELRACCVTLGYAAESTFGNALETRTWMENEKYHSLRLVTANYHMPRSLMVFHAAMPDVAIVPYPIMPDDVKLADWWQWPGTASLLVTEYGKYLAARLRLWIGNQ